MLGPGALSWPCHRYRLGRLSRSVPAAVSRGPGLGPSCSWAVVHSALRALPLDLLGPRRHLALSCDLSALNGAQMTRELGRTLSSGDAPRGLGAGVRGVLKRPERSPSRAELPFAAVVQELGLVRLCNPMDCSMSGFPDFHYLQSCSD